MTTVRQTLAASPAGFGTSGLRGLVGDLSDEVCFAATLGFLRHMRDTGAASDGPALFAHDLRPSSPRIARAVAAAIRHAGFEPVFGGEIPTPALALAGFSRNAPSVMITGSHIPFDRNGIKFHRPQSEISKADEAPILECEAELPDHLDIRDLPPFTGAMEGGYAARYLAAFPELLKDMRVGLYQHSAVGRDLNAALFGDMGARVAPLGRSDEFVPIDTEAVSDADQAQARTWAEQGLDCIVSTDGDGDRPLLADENGEYFRGDMLGILCARFLGAEAIVTPVSSNTALEKSGWFERIERTRIGSPHVIAAMDDLARERDRVAGFEANGGFLTRTPFEVSGETLAPLPTRDALLPVLAAIALAKRENCRLSELRALLPNRVTRSDRLVNRPTSASLEYLADMDETAEATLLDGLGTVRDVDTTDGRRMTLGDDRIVHLRPSGNAPEFRIYVEAETADAADETLAFVKDRLGRILPKG